MITYKFFFVGKHRYRVLKRHCKAYKRYYRGNFFLIELESLRLEIYVAFSVPKHSYTPIVHIPPNNMLIQYYLIPTRQHRQSNFIFGKPNSWLLVIGTRGLFSPKQTSTGLFVSKECPKQGNHRSSDKGIIISRMTLYSTSWQGYRSNQS